MYTANGGPLSGFSELLRGGVSSTITGVMPPLSVVTEWSSVRIPLSSGTVETETMAFSSGRAPSAVVTSTRSSAVPSVDAVMENLLVSGWKNRYNKGDKP